MDRLEELRKMFSEEPFGKTLGARLEVLERGRVVISLTVTPELAIVSGIAQAGVILSLADYAGVYAAMSMLPSGFTPASDGGGCFTRPAKLGEVMRAEAVIEDGTKSCLVARVTVTVGGRRASSQMWKYAKPRS